MSAPIKGIDCGLGCWVLAAGAGLMTLILLLMLGDYRWPAAVFLGLVVFLGLGLLTTWVFCGDQPRTDAGTGAVAEPAAPVAAKPAPEPAAKPLDAAAVGPVVKPSRPLAGQEELSARKGTWKYGDAPAAPAAGAAAGDGPGTKPMTYDAPPDAGADDLKKIKGVGPKLEKMCNSLGFYTFAQIAAWTPDEIAWVDQNLEGFKGRVSRDAWVEQAKLLATGAETEFSRRADTGGA